MSKEIMEHIATGKRVLVRSYGVWNRAERMRVFFGEFGDQPELKFRLSEHRVLHESGGYVHFASEDWEVMGMEYHIGHGNLTPTMRSRVRL